MQQKPATPATTSLREIDIAYYITHYSNLAWRWKWYILISAPLVMAACAIYVLKFGSVRPELDTSVIIGMENSQEMSAVHELGESVQSRIDLVRGRSFLKGIVESLSLQLVVNEYPRHLIFDSISVDSLASIGNYQFTVDKSKSAYEIIFNNQQFGVKNKLLDHGDLVQLNSFKTPGMYLKFSNSFLQNPYTVKFSFAPLRATIEKLRKNITIVGGNPTSRGGTSVSLVIKGRDYHLITKTVNLIADIFVEKTLSFKTSRSKEVIEVLRKQLEAAAEQLNQSQSAIQHFREQYPNVGLTDDMMNSITNLAQVESNITNTQSFSKNAEELKIKLQNSLPEDLNFTITEAITFLLEHRVSAASALQSEFSQLQQRQQVLRAGYDRNHPYLVENRNQISLVQSKVSALLSTFITTATDNVTQQKNQVPNLTQRMQGLPALQLRFAELQRQAQINAEIHSSVLTRYNQAKISNATEVTDVFVMDYAVDPIPPPDFVNVMMLLAIGMLISAAVSLAPPIAIDFLDKTARSESELLKILSYPVLENIPIIQVATKPKKQKSNAPVVRTTDKKLITSELSPDFANELFRSLRAKIMLRLYDIPKKKIIISSHNMNEGKSLISANIAITMAQQKLSTVIIDGDIRRGVQHHSFLLKKDPGLSSFLFSEEPVTPEFVQSFLQPTFVPNLTLISSGPHVPNPSELLSSPRFKDLINYLSSLFDVIIFDTPPIGLAADAALVSDLFSGCVLVIKSGATNVVELRKKLNEFPNIRNKVIGLVLNEALLDRRLRKYKYSSYYYNTEQRKPT